MVGDRVVDEAARVAQQVERLHRAGHHAEVELAAEPERLDGADAWCAVAAHRADEDDSRLAEEPARNRGELRRRCLERLPVHDPTAASVRSGCRPVGGIRIPAGGSGLFEKMKHSEPNPTTMAMKMKAGVYEPVRS